jgi:hypothetical protein
MRQAAANASSSPGVEHPAVLVQPEQPTLHVAPGERPGQRVAAGEDEVALAREALDELPEQVGTG